MTIQQRENLMDHDRDEALTESREINLLKELENRLAEFLVLKAGQISDCFLVSI